MTVFGAIHKWGTFLLFTGDLAVFYMSLWLTLLIRQAEVPTTSTFYDHAIPFSILFVVWILTFFIAGLYEKHTTILRSRLPNIIFNAQVVNSILAILFFYLIPYFGITPKTMLFIYLLVSFTLILFWRRNVFSLIGPRRREKAILVGSGDEMHELMREVNENSRYGLQFASSIDLDKVGGLDFQSEIVGRIYSENISTIVIDTKNKNIMPILPKLYNLIFSKVRFIDMHKVYEDIFDRIPLSLVQDSWFLENISVTRKFTYEFVKRVMDIVISFVLGVISLVVYPFAWFAVLLSDGGGLFIRPERVGKNNKQIKLTKFRTMEFDDAGEWSSESGKNKVTKVGSFLRKTRIDELPQLWNVLSGSISLIGPRPEFPKPVKKYEEEIPYYNVRHLIKPGLSGWAQLYHENHPHHKTDVSETKVKLSYDLYYIKNRSFLLDLKIALKTIKTLLSRTGV